jgi:hypothetical protein
VLRRALRRPRQSVPQLTSGSDFLPPTSAPAAYWDLGSGQDGRSSVESVIFTILLASGIRLASAAKIKSNEGGSGPLARLCLAWPRRPARALWDLLDRSAVPLASALRSDSLAPRHRRTAGGPTLDDQRAGNRQPVRSRISLTSSIDVSGCRNAKRPTVSPSHLVGGTNAISSSCNACAHLL